MADDWKIFKGNGKKGSFDTEKFEKEFPPPPWRKKDNFLNQDEECPYEITEDEVDIVNASLYLRRPILITGEPGVGKSTLAYAIACELGLGEVLHWHINSTSTVENGLYSYDAIARLQDSQINFSKTNEKKYIRLKNRYNTIDIKKYIKLNPLGIAFGSSKKRVLLIDEIDKSDIDLPNNLLQLFEDNYFEIDVLKRSNESVTFEHDGEKIEAKSGIIENNERDFPPAFMRRCLHHHISAPDKDRILKIVEKHLKDESKTIENLENIVEDFIGKREEKYLSTDQLLNALYLRLKTDADDESFEKLRDKVWHALNMS